MSDTKPFMSCGHVANATTDGLPCCVICAPDPKAYEVSKDPDISNRQAKCASCSKIRSSDFRLAFFEHRPNKPYDSYYCGCHGWD